MVIDFMSFTDILIEDIKELKSKHNLYKTCFAFKRKDYLRYIIKEKEEIRRLASVFDIDTN